MKQKSTGELMNTLKDKNANISNYYKENSKYMLKISNILNQYFNEYISKPSNKNKKITKSDIIRKCNIEQHMGLGFFNGNKPVTNRDHIIAIGKALELNIDELQILLKKCNFSPLYPKYKRDACIIYAYTHYNTVNDINIMLYDNKFNILFKSKNSARN